MQGVGVENNMFSDFEQSSFILSLRFVVFYIAYV